MNEWMNWKEQAAHVEETSEPSEATIDSIDM